MVRLHLVGFTTDLKNLIFADERGAKTGGFVVSVDSRLKNTLEEVARLGEEAEAEYEADEYEAYEELESEPQTEPAPPPPPRAPKVNSKLTPKEIQSLLRQGKSEEQVARLAGTKVDWIKRFSFAILAERQDVIDAVKAATLSKPRLGPSAMTVGEAVEENIGAKRIRMTSQEIEDAWKAVRKNGRWHVSFEYQSRGQKRLARYSFDPSTRMVEPLNEVALDLGWRADNKKPASPGAAPSPRVSGSIVKPTAARSSASAARAAGAARPAPRTAPGAASRPAAGSAPRPAAGSTRSSATRSSAGPEAAPRRPRPSPAPRVPPAPRTPLPPREPEASLRPPPPRQVDDERDSVATEQPELGSVAPETGAGYSPPNPRGERPPYSSLPKVWRPSRRP